MPNRTRILNYNSRNKSRRLPRPDGMVLIIVMIVATLMLIALTAAAPSVYQEGRREREEEAIFRGTQYARAVALFHRQFNRFPTSTKELMGTNGYKFLRKEFPDPLDPKGKWRFIHVNAAGVLLDSVNQKPMNANGNPAGIGVNNSSSTNTASGGGFSLGNSNTSNSSSGGGFSLGSSNSFGPQGGSSGLGMGQSSGGSGQTGSTSSFFGNSNEIQGAFIAGVAPTSKHESIRIWNKHDHYNQWEFIGLDMGVFGVQVGLGGGGAAPGMSQQNPGTTPGGFGLNNNTSGFTPPSN